LYPTAASFTGRADKEMTSLRASIHKDRWRTFVEVALPQLADPGWRPEDFARLKTRQLNALVQDLRSNNEEELGKERLQTNIFRGTPYAHVSLGTVAGINAITLDDVKAFARQMFTRANLTIGINGDASDEIIRDLQAGLRGGLAEGPAAPRVTINVPARSGPDVEILEKDTRATAISLGFPIQVTRAHPASISGSGRCAVSITATIPTSKRSLAACISSSPIRTSPGAGRSSKSGFDPWCRPTRT
jgi:zinc protease